MASKSCVRTSPEKQGKPTGNQTLERNSCSPVPLPVSKTSKAEADASKNFPRSVRHTAPKQVNNEATEEMKSLSSHQKGSSNDLDRKFNSSYLAISSLLKDLTTSQNH